MKSKMHDNKGGGACLCIGYIQIGRTPGLLVDNDGREVCGSGAINDCVLNE